MRIKDNLTLMKAEEIKNLFDSFESIAIDYDGVECWSARELYPVLGYAKWERFKDVLTRAKDSCINAGESVTDHFADVGKMIDLAKGAKRQIEAVILPNSQQNPAANLGTTS